MSTSSSIKIRIRGIDKSFGTKRVLDGLDLDVLTGESLIILGGSGGGKSVLLKHMIGLLQPDAGTVEVDGTDLSTLSYREITTFRRRFGMAFQEGALFDSMSVYDNIAFPLRRAARMDKATVDARVEECLALVRLQSAGSKMPAELSGGMRRRVSFARAIALEPQILLFDEPTTGLDPVLKATIDELIITLTKTLGATTVTISHDIESAFRIGDRLALLHRGRIVASGTPEHFRDTDDPRVRQFIDGRASGPLTEESDL